MGSEEKMMDSSAILGVAVGLVLALTGAGGAILAVPLLLFVLDLSVARAGPIALLAVGMSAAVGAALGLRGGIVRCRAAVLMAASGMMMSPIGLWAARWLPNEPLVLVFACVLAWVSWRMLLQGRACAGVHPDRCTPCTSMAPPCQLDPASRRFVWTSACARALMASGAGAGFLSGLLGVGGGFVIVPALRRATDAPMQMIVATSLAVITLVSMAGVAASALAGRMDWPVGLPFAAGAVVGMLGGRRIASRLSGPRLQQGFAVVAGLTALGMMAKVLLASRGWQA
ncbi:sulfite exporter TauE/SafE family protein [Mycetohabitans sp. B8]|uniref:sulfite exporter TauE/SafE family protein n=1 Tax=Mycetohabitans sp. B8 TaxID=2841845 RepID=UPI001F2D29F0|nr:sulfite exporter TauE/SafE family protein [Mycetohabitans sp. B8]